MSASKAFREILARFLEAPGRDTLREFLQNHGGEQNSCDFKEDWPSLAKMARHVLGIANSGGGIVIVGVRELEDGRVEPQGLNSYQDKADVEKGMRRFLPSTLTYEVFDFAYDSSEYPAIQGKKFQVVAIDDNPAAAPYICKADGDGVRLNAIYVRRGTNTEEVNYEELQAIFNRRLDVGITARTELNLDQHLGQLKTLYAAILQSFAGLPPNNPFTAIIRNALAAFGEMEPTPNPHYPKESYDEFVSQMIRAKKHRIRQVLDVTGLSAEKE